MMPTTIAPKPGDRTLRSCLFAYRQRPVEDPWKAFRDDARCGPCALALLHGAYGARCLYCDHAHGRTIDHARPKSKTPRDRFAWANWRPSCGDCNNLKGTRRVIDPAREDPRASLVFDLTTGEPIVVAGKARRPRAEATLRLLDNQTHNEARRAMLRRALDVFEDVAQGGPGADVRMAKLLRRETPHRAIIRELILERDDALNPHRALVDRVVARMPEIEVWAADPR